MVFIYVNSSIEDLYIIMVVKNNTPVCSDAVWGRYNMANEVALLVEEYQNKEVKVAVVGAEDYKNFIE